MITLKTTPEEMLYYLHCAKRYIRKNSGYHEESVARRRDVNRLIADVHAMMANKEKRQWTIIEDT